MLPAIFVPVFIVVLPLLWYGGIYLLHQTAKRRARAGTDIRE